MSLIDELSPGSYKGYTFLIANSRVAGGRKDVLHSYPNSNRQTVEDLGLRPRVYEVAAIINSNRQNENYIDRRNGLLATLELGGPGTLIHPMFGIIENVVARTWTLVEDLTELGDGKINITFTVSDVVGVPFKSQNTLSVIEKHNDDFLAAINSDVADNFNVNVANLNSFTDSSDTLNDMADSFDSNTNFLQASADKINAYSKELSQFEADITSLVSSPQALSDAVNNLFLTIGDLYPTAEATADVLAGFFDFNDNKSARVETTASRIERNKNDNLMQAAMQNMALSLAYFNTAQIEFETVTDIETRADALEIQYQKVIAADGLTVETKSELKGLRDNMQLFFDQQKLTARQLITINTPLTSARLLAYQFYGKSDEGEQILNLNNTGDASFISGDVTILTA